MNFLHRPRHAATPDIPALPDPYIPRHGSTSYAVDHYELELEVRLAGNQLQGRAVITARALVALDTVELDLVGLGMDKASVDGVRVLKHSHRQGKLRLQLPSLVEAGAGFTLDIRYSGIPAADDGAWGEVGWEELEDGVLVAGQPTGAPTWFPCNDRPDNKASYRFSVTTDADYTAVCNGVLLSRTKKSSRETWVYEQSAPMATYLATVQIGRYKLLALPARETQSQLPITVAVPKQLQAKAATALSRQREMVDVFTQRFGPYPFETYTVVVTADELEIPLEAQSLSILGRNHLDTGWESQRLIAHELSHQWFGNSLTVESWRDIWLHEGFACYAEWLWSEESGSMTVAERATAAHAKLRTEPLDLAVGDPGSALMFDDRVYKRGALALEALHAAAGQENFFALLQRWVAEHRHGSVSTAAFVSLADQVCAEVTGFSAAAILTPWLYQQQLPPLPRR
ncbi:M1 family metallopeptidase [Arthrobacter glacialis]|uniref:Aminopeptidase N n=1 Tax=Arthrobacter glacialis TaxID=1664 RepID=A0A2S3ZU73_ARTGL|nr:M1 family metallopeptidase [Arthrobacter glacialis]POH72778.1 peptidase M1 [Arthrobacter glacialis]